MNLQDITPERLERAVAVLNEHRGYTGSTWCGESWRIHRMPLRLELVTVVNDDSSRTLHPLEAVAIAEFLTGGLRARVEALAEKMRAVIRKCNLSAPGTLFVGENHSRSCPRCGPAQTLLAALKETLESE